MRQGVRNLTLDASAAHGASPVHARQSSMITGVNLVVDAGLTANDFIIETCPGESGTDNEDSTAP
jgi:hypothetical protein